MASTRTQIYLTDGQRSALDAAATAEGVTMAEIVRRALDTYLHEHQRDPVAALASTFGGAPDFAVPDRDEWDRG